MSSPRSHRKRSSRSRTRAHEGRRDSPKVSDFLPTTAEEISARGWEQADIVFVSGDAYIDHPSFAAAILGRWLEAHGFRVAILPQPDWKSAEDWRALGRPRLFYAVSAGSMDSMINHYTANKKRRNADAYSPGAQINRRPDRANAVYAQRCREAFRGVPVVTGGVEASLRRIAHYDYWSDKVWPSSLVTSKADLLVFGMGESTILEIAQRLDSGQSVADLRNMRGIAYLLGQNESLTSDHIFGESSDTTTVELPSFEQVEEDGQAFARATRWLHRETNPFNGQRLVQRHGKRMLVVNPPGLPLSTEVLDRVHELPYQRRSHPRYGNDSIPAWQTIKDSVQIMRGCFGGCTFCSITMHQGRRIQSRSPESVVREVKGLTKSADFKGHVSDIGGPTANMYRMRCTRPEVEAKCRRLSCVHPKVCKLLDTSHESITQLMRDTRKLPGVKSVKIASGIRMDLAADQPEYLEELAGHHVGGQLKVAPEHVSDRVLAFMKKPSAQSFDDFADAFIAASRKAGKEQYLVPYFIASHPGSGLEEMIELAVYLKRRGYRPRQVQDFIPAPMDIATCIYHTGIDPETLEQVSVARGSRDRSLQRALLQYWVPENDREVRRALKRAGREDLIGEGPDCLVPTRPPSGASRSSREGSPQLQESRRKPSGTTPGYRRASREGGERRKDGALGRKPAGRSKGGRTRFETDRKGPRD
ncbi:YgiQ family radical SAM protein [Myxococcota bacterium]|nr:YgiQ family radical SAM protein [Myxococcota bacterium]